MSTQCLVRVLTMAFLLAECVAAVTFSSRLIHRFSDEVKALRVSKKAGGGGGVAWPERRSLEYYRMLVSSDLEKQKMRIDPKYQLLFPSEGSQTMSLGNDFGW